MNTLIGPEAALNEMIGVMQDIHGMPGDAYTVLILPESEWREFLDAKCLAMTCEQKEDLRKHYSQIIKTVDANDILDHLYKDGIVTAEDMEKIRCINTSQAATREMMSVLMTKGQQAYLSFARAFCLESPHYRSKFQILNVLSIFVEIFTEQMKLKKYPSTGNIIFYFYMLHVVLFSVGHPLVQPNAPITGASAPIDGYSATLSHSLSEVEPTGQQIFNQLQEVCHHTTALHYEGDEWRNFLVKQSHTTMAESYRVKLQQSYVGLVRGLRYEQLDNIISQLRQDGILTLEQEEVILSKPASVQRNRQLLLYVEKKGNMGYFALIHAVMSGRICQFIVHFLHSSLSTI